MTKLPTLSPAASRPVIERVGAAIVTACCALRTEMLGSAWISESQWCCTPLFGMQFVVEVLGSEAEWDLKPCGLRRDALEPSSGGNCFGAHCHRQRWPPSATTEARGRLSYLRPSHSHLVQDVHCTGRSEVKSKVSTTKESCNSGCRLLASHQLLERLLLQNCSLSCLSYLVSSHLRNSYSHPVLDLIYVISVDLCLKVCK